MALSMAALLDHIERRNWIDTWATMVGLYVLATDPGTYWMHRGRARQKLREMFTAHGIRLEVSAVLLMPPNEAIVALCPNPDEFSRDDDLPF